MLLPFTAQIAPLTHMLKSCPFLRPNSNMIFGNIFNASPQTFHGNLGKFLFGTSNLGLTKPWQLCHHCNLCSRQALLSYQCAILLNLICLWESSGQLSRQQPPKSQRRGVVWNVKVHSEAGHLRGLTWTLSRFPVQVEFSGKDPTSLFSRENHCGASYACTVSFSFFWYPK